MTLDARLSKVFTMQRSRIEVFVEAFNATNKVNYASPSGQPAVVAVWDLDVDSREPCGRSSSGSDVDF